MARRRDRPRLPASWLLPVLGSLGTGLPVVEPPPEPKFDPKSAPGTYPPRPEKEHP